MSTNAIPSTGSSSTATSCTSLNSVGSYNKALQVTAVAVIYLVSSSAALLPVLATRFPRLALPQKVLFLLKHFGTGVLLATSFCHLLPTAFGSLLNPCLGSNSVWGRYPAMSGAISMAGLFLVVTVQLVFAEIHGTDNFHHHRSDLVDGPSRDTNHNDTLPVATRKLVIVGEPKRDPQMSQSEVQSLSSSSEEEGAFLRVALLELGILFHSVFIGMALSVSKGSSFVVLFIAIVFHQTFEGLSLGTRISLLNFSSSRTEPTSRFYVPPAYRPYIMGALYGITTPIGQAIGLILLYSPHTSYDPGSPTALVL
ncbi:hypothetical protein FRC16_005039, partial [Serendipita sp. 398]